MTHDECTSPPYRKSRNAIRKDTRPYVTSTINSVEIATRLLSRSITSCNADIDQVVTSQLATCCINFGRSYSGQNNPPSEASTNATAKPTGIACSRVRTKLATTAAKQVIEVTTAAATKIIVTGEWPSLSP